MTNPIKNLLVTISGPSLTGKTKLADLLLPYGFEELVSTTTRPPRKGEADGIDYDFISVEKFNTLIKNNLMIEHIQVGKNFYGVSKPAFDRVIGKGKNGVAVVEPEGAQRIGEYCRKNNIPVYQIFVNNPIELLIKRQFQRYKNDSLANDDEYTRRTIDMFLVEQELWVKPALNGKHHYDQIFNNFGVDSENEVIQSIMDGIKDTFAIKKNTTNKPR